MDLRFKVDWPGCGYRGESLLKGLQHRSRRAGLGALEMDLRRDRPGLCARAEIKRENDVRDERSILQPGVAVRRLDRSRSDQAGALEGRHEHGAERALVLVRYADRGRGRRAADHVAEQSEDDEGRDRRTLALLFVAPLEV